MKVTAGAGAQAPANGIGSNLMRMRYKPLPTFMVGACRGQKLPKTNLLGKTTENRGTK
jgi:hypothetical protein